MQCEWLGERVAAPDAKTVVKNVILNKTAGKLGSECDFPFPCSRWYWWYLDCCRQHSAKGERPCLEAKARVHKVNADAHQVTLKSGMTIGYKKLITTMAVDQLVEQMDDKELIGLSKGLF